MGHRLRPGWRRALLHHLMGNFREAQGCGYAYEGLRHLLRHRYVRKRLPRLLEEATDRLRARLLAQGG